MNTSGARTAFFNVGVDYRFWLAPPKVRRDASASEVGYQALGLRYDASMGRMRLATALADSLCSIQSIAPISKSTFLFRSRSVRRCLDLVDNYPSSSCRRLLGWRSWR